MNFTFLIGNGFDLNLGLRTDYPSFLRFYLEEKHDNALTNAIKNDIETWANLEEQLGIYAGTIQEDDIDEFISEKEELEASLVRYLIEESKRSLIIDSKGAQEFRDRIVNFMAQLTNEERIHYNEQVKQINEAIVYAFISFNYTLYLDRIVESAKQISPFSTHVFGNTTHQDYVQAPLHIHGTVYNEMLLGVNDESQIQTDKPHSYLTNYLVKPAVNRALGNQNITQAQGLIDKSKYICVFGMSLGMTDKDWWAYIAEWLSKSAENRLILFMHDKSGRIPIGSQAARKQDIIRRRFLGISGKLDEFDKISQQIIVRFNVGLFSFEHIKLEEKDG